MKTPETLFFLKLIFVCLCISKPKVDNKYFFMRNHVSTLNCLTKINKRKLNWQNIENVNEKWQMAQHFQWWVVNYNENSPIIKHFLHFFTLPYYFTELYQFQILAENWQTLVACHSYVFYRNRSSTWTA